MENLLRQGLGLALDAGHSGEAEADPARDLVAIAHYLIPTDAHVVCGCLVAAGLPAVLADDHHVQANLLIAPALGGVRILVPQAWLAQAQATLRAYERGEFALADDVDVGRADCGPDPR